MDYNSAQHLEAPLLERDSPRRSHSRIGLKH